jgi:hypothetical protein
MAAETTIRPEPMTHVVSMPEPLTPIILAVDTSQVLYVFIWAFVAIVMGVIGVFIARGVRARYLKDVQYQDFSLHDLRSLRDAGEITELEFQALRGSVIHTVETEGESGEGVHAREEAAWERQLGIDGSNDGESGDEDSMEPEDGDDPF